MIAASRRLPPTTCNKLHSKFSSFGTTTYSAMPTPGSPLRTDTPSHQSFEWSSNLFSGENKERTISLLSTDRDNSAFNFKKFGKDCRPAAVLVPFCYDIQGRPGILYNLRSETLSTHKGEISFPGGTFEPEDKNDPITAALRETHEELGITKEQVDIWTVCRIFPTVSSKMGVAPVVGFIKDGPVDPDKLEINPDEVDHAFVISLDHLCNSDNWAEMEPPRRLGRSSPSFTLPTYKNLHEISERLQDVHLWGLTAFITHLVLSAFIPQKYKRKVPYIELVREKQEDKECSNKEPPTSQVSEPPAKL